MLGVITQTTAVAADKKFVTKIRLCLYFPSEAMREAFTVLRKGVFDNMFTKQGAAASDEPIGAAVEWLNFLRRVRRLPCSQT